MTTTVRAIEGDTVDQICMRYFGRTAGVTEAVYENNPGLAELGPVLPRGTLVRLPQQAPPPVKQGIQLWD